MKIVTIVGARPQFIKAAAVSRAIAKHNDNVSSTSDRIHEVIVHTGQHYDANMSRVFFDELDIPKPHLNLGVGSGSHSHQTGQIMIQLEKVLQKEDPDWILLYGDTNSTLAGAITAVKLHLPIVHIEAGLRSFNRRMPEEHNRVLTDHCADLLFCPTETAVKNLMLEGIKKGVHIVGDVMYDSVLFNMQLSQKKSDILNKLSLKPKSYALATVHRAENTDDMDRLAAIFSAFDTISSNGIPVVIPLHPRAKKKLIEHNISTSSIFLIESVSYLDMLMLEKNAQLIMTDSGGVQKEAFWMKAPCITLRDETEWLETIESGWNVLAGADKKRIIECVNREKSTIRHPPIFGNGNSAKKIIDILISC